MEHVSCLCYSLISIRIVGRLRHALDWYHVSSVEHLAYQSTVQSIYLDDARCNIQESTVQSMSQNSNAAKIITSKSKPIRQF